MQDGFLFYMLARAFGHEDVHSTSPEAFDIADDTAVEAVKIGEKKVFVGTVFERYLAQSLSTRWAAYSDNILIIRQKGTWLLG